jgi:gliding motility-associated-like protein
MKKYFLLVFTFLFSCLSFAGITDKGRTSNPFEQKVFTQNKGQYNTAFVNKTILYHARSKGVDFYFTPSGIIYKYDKPVADKKPEHENAKKEEKKIKPVKYISQTMELQWLGANKNSFVVPEQMQQFYYTYGYNENGKIKNIVAHTFSKITYKEIYPNIDIEIVMPTDKAGIKYSLILRPGADLSNVQFNYLDSKGISINPQGDLTIKSIFGDFTDHAPLSFYARTNQKINSSFVVNGNTVKFKTDNYDKTQTIIIDPWQVNPGFAGYNAAYDIDYDNAGNVYAFGSHNPLEYAKYDNTGALQWIYVMLGTYYAYGDFAVDETTGVSYLAEGKTGPTLVHQIDANGLLVAQSPSNDGEMWRMVRNIVTNEYVIGNSGANAEIMNAAMNFTLVQTTTALVNDNVLLAIDCFTSNDVYMAGQMGLMQKVPANSLIPPAWQVNNGYTFNYAAVRNVGGWAFPVMGYNGMAVSPNWLYTFDGATLKQWNKNSGALAGSIATGGIPQLEGGLTVDNCDNVYVGVNSSIIVYNQGLNVLTTISLPDTVYDLKLGKNGLIYACGMGFVAEIQVPSIVLPTLTLSQTPATCSTCNGTATVNVSNSCVNATYVWSPGGQTTTTATGLCAGTYTVVASVGCNTTFSDTVTVGNTSGITLAVNPQNVLCNGQSNGSATANPSGGTAPYTYQWSNSQTTQIATGLGVGTYTVIVTDANGCSSTQAVTITQPTALTVSATPTNTSCGNNNGGATATPAGGTGPYTYLWSPSGGTNATATGLAANTYTVVVTDANGCTQQVTVVINSSVAPSATIQNQTNVLCNGASTGAATVNASGNSPFTYLWSNTQTSQTTTGLAAGTYTVTVTDVNGCTVQQTVTITQPAAIAINTSSTQTNCIGSNGTATSTPSGGTPGYTYLWNNGQTTQTATALAAGTYTVVVTDANGCTQQQTVTVTVNNPVTLAVTSTPSACSSGTGSATANPANGTNPYTYSWNNGQTTQTATGLAVGTYTVVVTDASGCSQTQTIVVAPLPGPTANATATLTTISFGDNTQLNATGGLTYTWIPATGLSCTTCANPVATPLQTTTYCAIATDVNGCSDTACVTVIVEVPCGSLDMSKILPNAFSPNSDGINNLYCVPANVCIANFVIKVYDRLGEKVFESTNFTNCWDGTYKGKPVNTGVFVYYFDCELSTGESYSQKGNISLVR